MTDEKTEDPLRATDASFKVGPPWLVLARPGADGVDVVKRETFSGAAFRRIIAARDQFPGTFVAVMDGNGKLACHSTGRLYSPVTETKDLPTDTDRAVAALARAEKLLQRADTEQRRSTAPNSNAFRTAGRLVAAIGASFVAAIIVAGFMAG